MDARYLKLLQNTILNFVEKLPRLNLRDLWFQQDCTPAHKTFPVKQCLVKEFGNRIIGYGGVEDRFSRSPDLTPLDFFLWGYMKQQVTAIPIQSFHDLKRRIMDTCASVSRSMLQSSQYDIQTRT